MVSYWMGVDFITIGEFSKNIKKFLLKQHDYPIGIGGQAGVGKSTLGIKISHLIDDKWEWRRNLLYTRQEVINAFNQYPMYSSFVIDEAINVMFNREAMKGKQVEAIKLLNVNRFRRQVPIFILPDFFNVDSAVRNVRINCYIYVIRRGLAAIFLPLRNAFGGDVWCRTENAKIYEKFLLGKVSITQIKNFAGFIRYSPLRTHWQEIYNEVQKEKKAMSWQEERPEEDSVSPKEKREIIFGAIKSLKENNLLIRGWKQVLSKHIGVTEQTINLKTKSDFKKEVVVNETES